MEIWWIHALEEKGLGSVYAWVCPLPEPLLVWNLSAAGPKLLVPLINKRDRDVPDLCCL